MLELQVYTTTSGSNIAIGSVSQAGQMAQQVKVLDTKPDKLRLSLVPEIPTLERTDFHKSSPDHMAWTHTTHTHVNVIKTT